MSGPSAVEQIRKRHADIKTLYISGYTDDVVVRHGLLCGEVALLHKPFSPNDLAIRVRDMLCPIFMSSKEQGESHEPVEQDLDGR
jgi:DNA-binding response OmpR family regulator